MSDSTKIFILKNIEDYSGSNPQNMDRMAWYSSGSYWGPLSGLGYINELTDVNITSPADKAVLRYDHGSGDWIDTTINLDYLSDVNIPSPQDGWTLFYDGVTSKWVGGQSSGSTAAQLLHVFNEGISTGSTAGSYFETNYAFVESTLRVYHNGDRLANDEFYESGTLDGFYTMFMVNPSDDLVADYARPTSGSVGSVGNANAVTLKSRDIASTAPADSQYLGWDDDAQEWEPKTIQRVIVFTVEGEVELGEKNLRFYYPFSSGSMYITKLFASVNTAAANARRFDPILWGVTGGSALVGHCSIAGGYYTGKQIYSLPNRYFGPGYYLKLLCDPYYSTGDNPEDLTLQIIGRLVGVTG